MNKLLVNAPSGAQELLEVGEGGEYFDPERVVWDERDDGPMPAITLGGMVWDGDNLVYSQVRMDQHTAAVLQPARAAAWEDIKAERDRRKWAGVKVGAHWFHSDDPSRIQFLALDTKGVPQGLLWKTLTLTPPPVFVPMTPALADEICLAIMASDSAIFQVAEGHRMAMEAAADPRAYDFSGGWPISIGDTP